MLSRSRRLGAERLTRIHSSLAAGLLWVFRQAFADIEPDGTDSRNGPAMGLNPGPLCAALRCQTKIPRVITRFLGALHPEHEAITGKVSRFRIALCPVVCRVVQQVTLG